MSMGVVWSKKKLITITDIIFHCFALNLPLFFFHKPIYIINKKLFLTKEGSADFIASRNRKWFFKVKNCTFFFSLEHFFSLQIKSFSCNHIFYY